MYGMLQYYRNKRSEGNTTQVEGAILTPNHQGGPLKPPPLKRDMTQVNWREMALRRRKVADCQIIGCVVTSGLLILAAGLGMFLAAWFVLGKEDPFILIGPVFAGCGIVVLLLSVEVCVRRQKVIKLTEDLSSDEEDGHYIDEGLINYGFGHFHGDDPGTPISSKSPAHSKSPAYRSPIVVRSQAQGGEDDESYKPSFDKVASDPRTGPR
ncbi:uncharacterized protein LOC119114303 isoform X2 [Pollicipes pollicipes]|uniref:uncharacterized protein LOC119114303 isoform X2 n=2 Tax=Pollicipes pollicipes TaxID=41117 RepID=UPI001884A33D|nr:uncharacterized protein LOC119114303 isoform X2 [Pollicipes pollicipes]